MTGNFLCFNLYRTHVKVELPGIDSKTYSTDEKGYITVPKDDLPNKYYGPKAQAKIQIAGEDDFVESAENTIVPARMQVRLVISESKVPTVGGYKDGLYAGNPCINIWIKLQRNVRDAEGKDNWEAIPAEAAAPRLSGAKSRMALWR